MSPRQSNYNMGALEDFSLSSPCTRLLQEFAPLLALLVISPFPSPSFLHLPLAVLFSPALVSSSSFCPFCRWQNKPQSSLKLLGVIQKSSNLSIIFSWRNKGRKVAKRVRRNCRTSLKTKPFFRAFSSGNWCHKHTHTHNTQHTHTHTERSSDHIRRIQTYIQVETPRAICECKNTYLDRVGEREEK